ncbi:NfeD family protein [Fusicatenibacter sp.]
MEFAVYWLIALIVFLVIEAATLGLATIWFAGGALVALIAAMCGAGLGIQVASFLVVSLVLLIFTRPFAVRFLSKDTLKTNVDRVIGMEGVVTEEISNLAGTGKVSLGGNIWTARTENEGGTIPVDAVVAVLRVEGVKLIVKVKEKEGGNET